MAISASLDWFENHTDDDVPTALEMSSLLTNFSRRSRGIEPANEPEGPIAATDNGLRQPPPATPPPSAQQVAEDSMVQATSPHLAKAIRSWTSFLGALAVTFVCSLLSIFLNPNRRQGRPEDISTLAMESSLDSATRGEATRSGQPRRASDPAVPEALQEAVLGREGRLVLEQSTMEAEACREAQRARARVEDDVVEDRVMRIPAPSTPACSNTFSHPEYSGDSDEEDEVEGLTRYGAQKLWIPRGYKSLAAGGECKYGAEFDLPDWVKIESSEEAVRLAEAWNDRVLGPNHRDAEDLRALPTVRLEIPWLTDRWLSQEEMADRFACQQEFEKLVASVRGRTDDPDSLAELSKRMVAQAEEAVRQRKKAVELRTAVALSRDDGSAGPTTSSLNHLPESSGGGVNPSLLQAKANAERYNPKVPSGLSVVKNMSPM